MTSETLMHVREQGDTIAGNAPTMLKRTSDREIVVTRTIDGPARIVLLNAAA